MDRTICRSQWIPALNTSRSHSSHSFSFLLVLSAGIHWLRQMVLCVEWILNGVED